MKRFVLIVLILFVCAAIFAQEHISVESVEPIESTGHGNTAVTASEQTYAGVLKYFAAALAVGISCIAGGMAVAKIGTAAMGAMSENADLSGKAIPYAGLAEGICLWGFLIGLLILFL